MKRHLKFLTVIAAAVILAACGGGGGASPADTAPPPPPPPKTPAQKIADLESSGALPKLDRSAGIAGVDANNNGVRDDIDALVASRYPTAPQRAAATQMAGVFQAAMLVDKANAIAVRAVSVRSSRAVHCVYTRFTDDKGDLNPSAVMAELRGSSANTKERLKAYLAFSKALDGTTSSIPEGDTCE